MLEKIGESGRELILILTDPLTEETRMRFRGRLDRALQESLRTVTLDCSDVRALSSSWIGSLLLYRGRLKESGCLLRIKGCSRELLKVLLLIRLDTMIPIEA